MKKIVFYYDIVCPFAYVASRVIERLAKRTKSEIQWKPVLLGGLYKGTTGDGDSSIYEQMADAKKIIQMQDLRRTMYRNGIKQFNFPSEHPRRTLNTMRLLAAAASDQQQTCINLTHWLYRAYWVHDKDVTSMEILKEGASSVGWPVNVEKAISGVGREKLLENTQEALDRGAFGVPSFWVNDRLIFGVDHMHILESILTNKDVPMPRLAEPPAQPTKAKLTIYHDFASPWSYLGSTQIPKLIKSVLPVSVEVEWVPILVGVLFKAIGTPMVPMQALSPAKRAYGAQDFDSFCKYHKVPYKWTSHFPLRTILPGRVCIADGDDRLRQTIYEAGWRYDKNIGDEQVLHEVLSESGFDADRLIAETKKQEIKDKLRDNTERAIAAGVCGVPSYQVNDGPVLWGQDRLSVVADMICGWQDVIQMEQAQMSKL